jgi:ankyrin repeat protein
LKEKIKTTFGIITLVLGLNLVFNSNIHSEEGINGYLLFSTEKGYVHQVKSALKQGASVYCKDYFQKTPLIHAVQNGNMEIIQLLVKHGAVVTIHERDRDGHTALYYARKNDYTKIEKYLIELGAVD